MQASNVVVLDESNPHIQAGSEQWCLHETGPGSQLETVSGSCAISKPVRLVMEMKSC